MRPSSLRLPRGFGNHPGRTGIKTMASLAAAYSSAALETTPEERGLRRQLLSNRRAVIALETTPEERGLRRTNWLRFCRLGGFGNHPGRTGIKTMHRAFPALGLQLWKPPRKNGD